VIRRKAGLSANPIDSILVRVGAASTLPMRVLRKHENSKISQPIISTPVRGRLCFFAFLSNRRDMRGGGVGRRNIYFNGRLRGRWAHKLSSTIATS
jgi:hypothetical protein